MTTGYFAKVDLQFNSLEETQRIEKLLRENFDGKFDCDEQSITCDLFFEVPFSTNADDIIGEIRGHLDESVIPEGYIDVYQHGESYCIDGEELA